MKIILQIKNKRFVWTLLLCIALMTVTIWFVQWLGPDYDPASDWHSVNVEVEAWLALKQQASQEYGAESAQPKVININTAHALELESLPGIGPVKAKTIVEYREKNGDFRTIEELQNVSGIGPATFERLSPWISIEDSPEM